MLAEFGWKIFPSKFQLFNIGILNSHPAAFRVKRQLGRGAESCSFTTGSCKGLTEEIMGAQNFNYQSQILYFCKEKHF